MENRDGYMSEAFFKSKEIFFIKPLTKINHGAQVFFEVLHKKLIRKFFSLCTFEKIAKLFMPHKIVHNNVTVMFTVLLKNKTECGKFCHTI